MLLFKVGSIVRSLQRVPLHQGFAPNRMQSKGTNVFVKPAFPRSDLYGFVRYSSTLKGRSDKELQDYFTKALQTGGPHAGIKACLDIVRENPTCWNAMDSLALLYGQTGDIAKANEWTDKALLGSPHRFQSHNNKGYQLVNSGDYEKALYHLQIAYGLRTSTPEITQQDWSRNVCNMAGALLQLNRRDEALELLRKELNRDPKNPDFFLNYAVNLAQINRIDDARAAAKDFVERGMGFTTIEQCEGIGYLMGYLGYFEIAKLIYESALNHSPSAYYHFSLARSNYCLLNYNEAYKHISKAVALEQNNPLYNFALLECATLVGKYDEAEQTASICLLLYGVDSPMAVPVLAMLENIYKGQKRQSDWMTKAVALAKKLGKPAVRVEQRKTEGGPDQLVMRWQIRHWYAFYLGPEDKYPPPLI